MKDFKILEGKILTEVIREGDERIIFVCENGDRYTMQHHQDCCESVTIDDVCGDLSDLIGTPILLAEEVTSRDEIFSKPPHGETLLKAKFLRDNIKPKDNEFVESETWTFYKLRTIKGSVDIRWYGESNGYYSESVTIDLLEASIRGK